MQERYFLQEMKVGGYPYYEIIDTADGCEVVDKFFDYCDTVDKLEELKKVVELMEIMQADFDMRLFPARYYDDDTNKETEETED